MIKSIFFLIIFESPIIINPLIMNLAPTIEFNINSIFSNRIKPIIRKSRHLRSKNTKSEDYKIKP